MRSRSSVSHDVLYRTPFVDRRRPRPFILVSFTSVWSLHWNFSICMNCVSPIVGRLCNMLPYLCLMSSSSHTVAMLDQARVGHSSQTAVYRWDSISLYLISDPLDHALRSSKQESSYISLQTLHMLSSKSELWSPSRSDRWAVQGTDISTMLHGQALYGHNEMSN